MDRRALPHLPGQERPQEDHRQLHHGIYVDVCVVCMCFVLRYIMAGYHAYMRILYV